MPVSRGRREGRLKGCATGSLVEQRAQRLDVLAIRAEIGASDHGPRTDPEVVEARADECRNAALGLRSVVEAAAERISEERGHVVLAIG